MKHKEEERETKTGYIEEDKKQLERKKKTSFSWSFQKKL